MCFLQTVWEPGDVDLWPDLLHVPQVAGVFNIFQPSTLHLLSSTFKGKNQKTTVGRWPIEGILWLASHTWPCRDMSSPPRSQQWWAMLYWPSCCSAMWCTTLCRVFCYARAPRDLRAPIARFWTTSAGGLIVVASEALLVGEKELQSTKSMGEMRCFLWDVIFS